MEGGPPPQGVGAFNASLDCKTKYLNNILGSSPYFSGVQHSERRSCLTWRSEGQTPVCELRATLTTGMLLSRLSLARQPLATLRSLSVSGKKALLTRGCNHHGQVIISLGYCCRTEDIKTTTPYL